jgi:excisionase family DNA binding protein
MARASSQAQLSLAWSERAADDVAEQARHGVSMQFKDGAPEGALAVSPPEPSDNLLLTVAEVARTLQIGRRQAWEMVWRGDLPVVRLGPRTIRVAQVVLQRYVVGKESSIRDVSRVGLRPGAYGQALLVPLPDSALLRS